MTPMEEKRVEITDNYIIKDLNRCANTDVSFCKECTHRNFIYSDESSCCIRLMKSAIALIKRQKAEIERLEKENNQFADIGKMYSEIKSEAIKEFAERLKKAFPQSDRNNKCPSLYFDDYIEIIEQLAEEMKGGE